MPLTEARLRSSEYVTRYYLGNAYTINSNCGILNPMQYLTWTLINYGMHVYDLKSFIPAIIFLTSTF